jgi:hypothetical protein
MLTEQRFEMFQNILGTWLPFLLIFNFYLVDGPYRS